MRKSSAAIAALFGILSLTTAASATPPSYKITKTVPLGSPDNWDYLYFEPTQHRVYIAHGNEITVVDGHSGEIVGRVQGLQGVNGIAAIPALGKGYTDSRAKKTAVVFDLTTFKVTKEIPADEDTDALIYDPTTKRIFVAEGDPNKATVIDATTDKPVATIALGGDPEYMASDDAGHVFVNIADKKQIIRVDSKTGKVEARWPVNDCESPHGLSIDRDNHRLFVSCVNSKMLVVDDDKGTVVATLPIGKGTDAAAFDPKRKLAFSSNAEGTLSVIAEESPDKFTALGEVPTKPFARTMTLDPESGRIYLVTADVDEVNPSAENPRQRYKAKPGTAQLLFLDPQ